MANDCKHFHEVIPREGNTDGCEECLQTGDSWVHLRVCLACGHVGCCDDSRNKHATRHFHATGHSVIRSDEPGETWGWLSGPGIQGPGMTLYAERSGRLPAFEVAYRFLGADEGGRTGPPHQHTRWDFLYEGDDPKVDSIWMIWPEFIGPDGRVLPEGQVPSTGRASMFIVDPDKEPYHRARIAIGTKGAFVEGARTVAVCEVVAIHGLANR